MSVDGKDVFIGSHSPLREATPEMTTAFLLGLNEVVLSYSADRVLKAMKAMADHRNFPLVFGCMTGKDRTGLLAALTLGALGADK
eukprot:SAG31_NODE_18302_length_641_cov_0.752768_2_plen_84_part_01